MPTDNLARAESDSQLGAASHELKRKCPYCAEVVLAQAVVCKYCSASLEKPGKVVINTAWILGLLEGFLIFILAFIGIYKKEPELYLLLTPSAAISGLSIYWMSIEKPIGFILAAFLNAAFIVYDLVGPGRPASVVGLFVFAALFVGLPIVAAKQAKRLAIFKQSMR